ncbi:MAG: SusC/RagA family TonB-linked outer membrane protein [Bacteroidaceae bacterium]|nr:SusC/RagA family TonB-linked outer membrane protein [Prevotella sp.]MBR3478357.1 SusC/RagA family TonB-linked outer membrane protein [Bacteroidaceae bacterium]
MKRRLSMILAGLFLIVGGVLAQTKVNGTVVSQEDNQPVIGVSVLVVGTNVGTVTDANGRFSLTVPEGKSQLRFTYVGMETLEVSARPNMRIVLRNGDTNLDEIVVTALGMNRQQRTLGYANTTVKSDELTISKSGNLMDGLQGKVAGVNIASSGSSGMSQKVVIRGISSVSSNNPLYIVDGSPITNERVGTIHFDFGNGASDLNPEDIESVTVLKGASATALYGSRAANGVVMITTKKASANNKMELTYDGSLTLTDNLRVPMTQDLFGEGWGSWSNEENGSWGPRLDGRMHWWGSPNLDPLLEKPYSYVKNNIRDFYQTGTEWNNNVSLRYGNEKVGISASYGNVSSNGILPNNGDTYYRNTFSLRGYANIDKFHLDMSMNYVHKDEHRPVDIYSELLQGTSDVRFADMKDYNDIRFNNDNYFTLYAYNPYWMVDNNYSEYSGDRVYGRLEVSYDILSNLKILGRIGGDFDNYKYGTTQARLDWSEGSYQATGNGTTTPEPGFYSNYGNNRSQIDASILLMGNHNFGNFGVNAILGWNLNQRSYWQTGAYNEALDIDGWYAFNNTTSYSIAQETQNKRRLIGLLGQIELNWKDWAFLNLSARNDYSSTLPIGNNSYFYGGINGSVVLNEAIPALKEIKQIDYLKVRAAVGQTGNDAGVYMTTSYYTPWKSYYTYLPINGVSGLTEFNRLPNTDLKPEITTEYELGLAANFFNNRLNLDFGYYNRQTKNQIISATLAPEMGYTSNTRNVGKLENKGIELALNFTPIRSKDWEWNVGLTYTKNWSKVKELWDDLEEYTIGVGGYSSIRNVSYVLKVGEPIGIFKLPAAAIVEDESSPYYGYNIVNNNGFKSASTTEYDYLGTSQPDFIMGFNTHLKWKNLSLSATGDWHKGGLMYTETSYITHFNGNSTETVFNERDAFVIPHSVRIVNGEYVENNIPINAYYMCYGLGNYQYNPDVRRQFVVSRSYFKLRELALTYDFPKSLIAPLRMQKASFSLVGHNLFLITPKKQNYVDPETSNLGNDIESEFGEMNYGTISTRTYGFNVKVVF